jgi:hypothetical protein
MKEPLSRNTGALSALYYPGEPLMQQKEMKQRAPFFNMPEEKTSARKYRDSV